MFIELPKFADKYEAATYAVQWAKDNPHIYVSFGGPKYPVPPAEMLEKLEKEFHVTIQASAGCEICNYEDVFAKVVNDLLPLAKARVARACLNRYVLRSEVGSLLFRFRK